MRYKKSQLRLLNVNAERSDSRKPTPRFRGYKLTAALAPSLPAAPPTLGCFEVSPRHLAAQTINISLCIPKR